MALTISDLGSGTSTTNDTTLVSGATITASVGDVLLLCIAASNSGASGAAAVISSVVDNGGVNTYIQRGTTGNRTAASAANDGASQFFYECLVTSALVNAIITITFSANNPQKAVQIYRLQPGAGENVQFISVGTATSGLNTTHSPTSVAVDTDETIIGMAAIQTDDAITGDSDTLNGSWSTRIVRLADGGVDADTMTCTSQYKTATGDGNQSWTNATSTARESARNTIIYTFITAVELDLVADAGSFNLTGTAAGTRIGREIVNEVGSFNLTGQTAGLTKFTSTTLMANSGSFNLTGIAAVFEHAFDAGSGGGTSTVGVLRPALRDALRFALRSPLIGKYSGGGFVETSGITVPAAPGAFTLTGATALTEFGYYLLNGGFYVDPGSDDEGGEEPPLFEHAKGEYTLAGAAATLHYNAFPNSIFMPGDEGGFVLAGTDADLDLVVEFSNLSNDAAMVDPVDRSVYTFDIATGMDTADPDRLMIVPYAYRSAVEVFVSSITIGGVTAAVIPESRKLAGATLTACGIAYAVVPTNANTNCVITLTGNAVRCGVVPYRTTEYEAVAPTKTGLATLDGIAGSMSPSLTNTDKGFCISVAYSAVSGPQRIVTASANIAQQANKSITATVAADGTVSWLGLTEDQEITMESPTTSSPQTAASAAWKYGLIASPPPPPPPPSPPPPPPGTPAKPTLVNPLIINVPLTGGDITYQCDDRDVLMVWPSAPVQTRAIMLRNHHHVHCIAGHFKPTGESDLHQALSFRDGLTGGIVYMERMMIDLSARRHRNSYVLSDPQAIQSIVTTGDGIGFAGYVPYSGVGNPTFPSLHVVRTIIKGISGQHPSGCDTCGSAHADGFEPVGPMKDFRFKDVHVSSVYQGIFTAPHLNFFGQVIRSEDQQLEGGVITFDNVTATPVKPPGLNSTELAGWRLRCTGYYLEGYNLRVLGRQSYFNIDIIEPGGLWLEAPPATEPAGSWLNFIAGKTVIHTAIDANTARIHYTNPPNQILRRGRSPTCPTEDQVGPGSPPL